MSIYHALRALIQQSMLTFCGKLAGFLNPIDQDGMA